MRLSVAYTQELERKKDNMAITKTHDVEFGSRPSKHPTTVYKLCSWVPKKSLFTRFLVLTFTFRRYCCPQLVVKRKEAIYSLSGMKITRADIR